MSDLSGGDAAGPVIETTGLRKEFRGRRGGLRVAVDDLDLAVPAGGVKATPGRGSLQSEVSPREGSR